MPKIIREKVFGVADALVSLCPQASWGLGSSGTYNDIRWQDQSIPLPTEEEINDEIQRLQTEWDSTSYQRQRMAAYPNIEDQLDQIYHQGIDSWKESIMTIKLTQTLSATYADVNGSSISYTPPEGTTRVKYIFNWAYYWPSGTQCIAHYNFYIDTSEVVRARFNTSAQYPEGRTSFEWVIAIGGSTDSNTGRQAVWTAAKNLKLQARFYGASNPVNIHGTRYWNGADSPQFSMPVLTIIAIK